MDFMIIKQFLLFPNHQKRGEKRGKEYIYISEGLISLMGEKLEKKIESKVIVYWAFLAFPFSLIH